MLSVGRTNYAKINLADPELELIDPTPNVHNMFIQFDQMFFSTKLASRAVVRWSKRMYSCAGVCSYEGRGGLCDIALSEPLLKLRPRKDLVETLLHEMIHAFLFVTSRDQDRDGHGPNFQAHMHRINNAAGLKISIYHDFHEEVQLYQTHWWRCDGPCQSRRPHYGIVRRTCNKPPGPSDTWWSCHQRNCGGTFVKFKEPENKAKKPGAKKPGAKPKGDITKYITTNKTSAPIGEPKILKAPAKNPKPASTKSNDASTVVLTQKGIRTLTDTAVKITAVFTGKANTLQGNRARSSSVDVAEAVRNIWANRHVPSTVNKPLTPPPYIVRGKLPNRTNNDPKTTTTRKRVSIAELVDEIDTKMNVQKPVKHKANAVHSDSPPSKVKKIDDYFKTTAKSLLKDIYGENIEIAVSSSNNKKLIAVDNSSANRSKVSEVDCPICKLKVDERYINNHLDECLNKDIISEICTSSEERKQPNFVSPSTNIAPRRNANHPVNLVKDVKPVLKEIHKNLTPIPPYKGKTKEEKHLIEKIIPVSKNIYKNIPQIPPYRNKIGESDGSLDYSVMRKDLDRSLNTMRGTFRNHTKHEVDIIKEPKNLDDNLNWEDVLKPVIPKTEFDPNDIDKVKSVVKKIQFDKHLKNNGKFIVPKEEKDLESGFLPSFIGDDARTIKLPPVKLEPGTSVVSALTEPKCPCCGNKVTTTIDEHLEECLAFFGNNGTMPEEGASTSFANHTIVIDDDDDIFDETQLLNATGTKLPCPCCLQMVEHDDMNTHLDSCLC
ncbi:hypothetical protein MSG28_006565 [Choristoneura fumiferana]|uniref:Uncharacterized protein n=1 Tax=Choristoneura fumiferana TaxID=7141 RepID=A0ACC0JFI5_CHOFU|nr:hypothetical protein MSG28_006565 [Choristoneura fumiferana]